MLATNQDALQCFISLCFDEDMLPGLKKRALALLSGGLDGQLAVCLLRDQGIDVTGLVFTCPLFDAEDALVSARELGIPVERKDFTVFIVDLFERCGALDRTGAQLCMDCHATMLKCAVDLLDECGCQFICTGDVLNQKSATQSDEAMDYIRQYIEKGDCVLRPLSAKLLPQTLPEREGWVNREQLLAVEGNQRKIQHELASVYGIQRFAEPSRVSRLTDPSFGDRLRDLRAHEGIKGRQALRRLRLGHHFRLGPITKLVVGRNEGENAEIEDTAELYDLILKLDEVSGPTGLLPIHATEDQIQLAAAICAHYSDVEPGGVAPVRVRSTRESQNIEVRPARSVEMDLHRI